MTPAAAKANPLWEFATWAYSQEGVEKACLSLHNRLGIDVNMLLFCMWLAYRGVGSRHLAQFLGSALKLSREWQRNLVEPLRTCRNNFKDIIENSALAGPEREAIVALRERVKQCELETERIQMLALYALVDEGDDRGSTKSPTDQKEDAQNNLTVYFAATGVTLDPLGQTHVLRILNSVFA